MKQKLIKLNSTYHISGKCTLPEWPQMPMEDIWIAFCNHVSVLSDSYQITPLSFVLMDNHFHFLCACSDKESFKEGLEYFQQACEGTMTLVGFWDQLFVGNKLYVKKLPSYSEILNCYKYIYRNPVEVGIVLKCEDYEFSTLYSQLNACDYAGCEDPVNLIFDEIRVINWLNNKSNQLFFRTH